MDIKHLIRRYPAIRVFLYIVLLFVITITFGSLSQNVSKLFIFVGLFAAWYSIDKLNKWLEKTPE